MKNYLTIAALFIVLGVHAQTKQPDPPKPSTPPKEQYKTDGSKLVPITITLNIPAGVVDSYLFVEQSGGAQAIQGSDRLTGAQITQLTKVHQAVVDSVNMSIYRHYQAFIKADMAKFSADTTAKYHPKK